MKQRSIILHWWLLVFFVSLTVTHRTQAQELELLDEYEYNSPRIKEANGQTRNVTFSGRTIYSDGDWNTLCLPFNMSKSQIASSPLDGYTIKALDGTLSNLDSNGKLTLRFNTAEAIEAGRPYIVKWPVGFTINDNTDWGKFVDNVASGKTYEGQLVKLNADVSISATDLVGTKVYPFKGIFDGGRHTITCNINYTNDDGAAPFHYIHDATIMNLSVAGSITGINHCAGLVGNASGTNTIRNCKVAANVTCSGTHCGGLLGHSTTSTTSILNCVYSGTISSTTTTNVGIIYGWSDYGYTGNITNCLAAGTYSATGTIDMLQGNGTVGVNNCYKTTEVGEQGTYTTASAADLANDLGSDNWTTELNNAIPKMNANNNLVNPKFNGVTISNTTNDTDFTGGTFKGNYDQLVINGDNRNHILLFASQNKIGYANTDRLLNAFRAYIYIPESAAVRSFAMDFGNDETTGIVNVEENSSLFTLNSSLTEWYSLDGRQLQGKPAQKGVYITKGRKIFIK